MHTITSRFMGGLGVMFTLAIVLFALASQPASACYSGLLLTPTADTVGAGNYLFDFEVDGNGQARTVDTYLLNSDFGIGSRLEAGVDYDFTSGADPKTVLNGKYQFLNAKALTMAVGFCSIGQNLTSNPYIVATYNYEAFRGHVGVIRTDGTRHWFVGADKAVTKKLLLLADYTSGDTNYSSFGVYYQAKNNIALLAGAEFPNTTGDTLFTAQLVLTGSYMRTHKEE